MRLFIYYTQIIKLCEVKMKVLSSLKSAKKRSSSVQLVRRGKRVYAIDKKNPRFKAKQ